MLYVNYEGEGYEMVVNYQTVFSLRLEEQHGDAKSRGVYWPFLRHVVTER